MTLVSDEVYVQQARSQGIDAEDLDEAVQDVLLRQASSINNGGLEEQIPFLREELGEVGLQQTLEAAAETVRKVKEAERTRQLWAQDGKP